MVLEKTLPGKTGPALPYDVFLNIIDILINQAEGCNGSMTWLLRYDHDSPTRLVVWDPTTPTLDPLGSPIQLARHHDTRLPAQINRTTRSHRKFVRVPVWQDPGNYRGPDAWIRSESDYFVPFFADHDDSSVQEELHYTQALMLPTPQGDVLTRAIERVTIPSRCFWSDANKAGIAALSTLPNLTKTYMAVGRFHRPERLPEFDGRLIRIDPDVFPDLVIWSIAHGHTFASLYRPLRKRGIRLYGFASDAETPVLEIVSNRRGIRVRYVRSSTSSAGPATRLGTLSRQRDRTV